MSRIGIAVMPQPGDEHDPARARPRVYSRWPAASRGTVDQPDALVVAQRVGGDAGALGHLGDAQPHLDIGGVRWGDDGGGSAHAHDGRGLSAL